MAFNDSFGPGDGGFGAGDMSYSQQNNAGSNNQDKVAVPVTIQDLCEIPRGDEKIIVGTQPFSTVRVVGEVVNVVRMGDQAIEYHIQDVDTPGGPTFVVMVYRSATPSPSETEETFVEGSLLHVVGKVRSFDDRVIIMSFQTRALEDEKEYKAHKLEARLAHLYYEKTIAQKAASGALPPTFAETMLRGSSDAATSKAAGGQPSVVQPYGGQQVFNEVVDNSKLRGLTGQRAKLFIYIQTHGPARDAGVHKDELMKLPGLNKDSVQKDLDYLTSEGFIYSSTDDEHYQTIN
uniref:Replication protein A C-terminal domain-containing protein n=1 Tax=Plectus sambesii TaxID=2011161 RepID=A0A914V772_9BILA